VLPLRPSVQIALHLPAPAAVTRLASAKNWHRAAHILMATMVVDPDHLLTNPLYYPGRCTAGRLS